MSKLMDKLRAKSKGVSSTADLMSRDVVESPLPRTGAIRVALLERMKCEHELPLTLLHEVPGRKRNLTPAQFKALKNNLAKNPLGTPITVRRLDSGGYEIIAGHQRVQAYRELGRERIPSYVVELTDEEATRVAAFTNMFAPPFEGSAELPQLPYPGDVRLTMPAGTKLTDDLIEQIADVLRACVTRDAGG